MTNISFTLKSNVAKILAELTAFLISLAPAFLTLFSDMIVNVPCSRENIKSAEMRLGGDWEAIN